jgi:multiple sugar transport system substrate-binding protein/sn-glycerol 3-phosphate transport system substrate-binding protein
MRKSLLLVGMSLLLALGTGLASAQDVDSVDPTGQTVVYWHQFSEAQAEAMTAIIEAFNSTNEWGITVEPVAQGGYNDIRELMGASIISGELPNLVAGYASDAASYALDGAAADLTPYINSATYGLTEEEAAGINQAIIGANTFTEGEFAGQTLAWAHQNSAQVLVVNNTMLESLGYDAAPASWDEFNEIACAAAESTGPNGEDIFGFPITGDSSEFETMVASRGGSIYADGAYQFTSEPVIETLQMIQDQYNAGCYYFPDRAYGNTGDFALGLNPMAPTSTAGFTFIINDFANAGIENTWSANTFPYTDGNQTIQVFAPSIILVPSTPEQDLASWLFLKYLTTPEAGAMWQGGTGYFSPSYGAGELVTEDTMAVPALAPYQQATTELLNDEAISVYTSPNVVSYGLVRPLVPQAVAAVTTGGEDVATVAERLQQQATDILEGN